MDLWMAEISRQRDIYRKALLDIVEASKDGEGWEEVDQLARIARKALEEQRNDQQEG